MVTLTEISEALFEIRPLTKVRIIDPEAVFKGLARLKLTTLVDPDNDPSSKITKKNTCEP